MPVRYAHSNIVATDWRNLADFYTEVFGCVLVPPERDQSGEPLERGTGLKGAALRGVHLRLPGHGDAGPTLEIYTYAEGLNRPASLPNERGLGHLAFEVDDVEATLRAVLERGGAALGEVTSLDVPGAGTITFVYARDPEGNILELQHWS